MGEDVAVGHNHGHAVAQMRLPLELHVPLLPVLVWEEQERLGAVQGFYICQYSRHSHPAHLAVRLNSYASYCFAGQAAVGSGVWYARD